MSIRTAIAGALVDGRVVVESVMFEPRGLLIVDSIVEAIIADSKTDGDLNRLVETAVRNDEGTAHVHRPGREIVARLREAGVIVVVDALQINLPPRQGIEQFQAEDR